MESIKLTSENIEVAAKRVADTINAGGIACFACNGNYRLAVNFDDEEAVMALLQSKRRVNRMPGLVFVEDQNQAESVGELEELAKPLVQKHWPGSLTVLVKPKANLSKKLLKQVTSKQGKLGLRVPDCAFTQAVLKESKKPLLISSANRVKKHGETSPAQIQKNFNNTVALFINQGDLNPGAKSTIIDPADGKVSIVREGALGESDLLT